MITELTRHNRDMDDGWQIQAYIQYMHDVHIEVFSGQRFLQYIAQWG